MMAWAEMAERHIDGVEIKEREVDRGGRRRGDVAVAVMTIVGSVLWSGPASQSHCLRWARWYDDHIFGRGYTRRSLSNISSVSFYCQLDWASLPA